MTIKNILITICSFFFFMIGADKFIPFLEPPCSLMNTISPIVWMVFGGLQITASILIWIPKYRKYVTGFFVIFMSFFSIYHLTQGTYDIGGAIFMAVLLGILFWNPKFLNRKKSKG